MYSVAINKEQVTEQLHTICWQILAQTAHTSLPFKMLKYLICKAHAIGPTEVSNVGWRLPASLVLSVSEVI